VVFAAALPTAVPGGVAKLALDAPAQASLGGNRVLVMREANGWVALVGIPLSTKPGAKLRVEVQYAERRERIEIAVARKKYPQQKLSMAPEQAELAPELLARYEAERRHIQEVLRTFSETAPASLALQQPVPGRRSGSFGLRRVINGVARSPHSGMDIAAASGTPVAAVSAGRVIDTGDYLFLEKPGVRVGGRFESISVRDGVFDGRTVEGRRVQLPLQQLTRVEVHQYNPRPLVAITTAFLLVLLAGGLLIHYAHPLETN